MMRLKKQCEEVLLKKLHDINIIVGFIVDGFLYKRDDVFRGKRVDVFGYKRVDTFGT